jgi:hypothetical protein
MSEGHPLVLYNESKHNILALGGKANKSLLLLLSSNLLHVHYYKWNWFKSPFSPINWYQKFDHIQKRKPATSLLFVPWWRRYPNDNYPRLSRSLVTTISKRERVCRPFQSLLSLCRLTRPVSESSSSDGRGGWWPQGSSPPRTTQFRIRKCFEPQNQEVSELGSANYFRFSLAELQINAQKTRELLWLLWGFGFSRRKKLGQKTGE